MRNKRRQSGGSKRWQARSQRSQRCVLCCHQRIDRSKQREQADGNHLDSITALELKQAKLNL